MTLSSSESPNEPSETAPLTEDDRHRLLSSERRRVLLDVLADRSTPVGLEALARAIGEEEMGTDAVDPETTERIAITLHHNHIPKLAEAGVVDYDARSTYVAAFRDRFSSRSP